MNARTLTIAALLAAGWVAAAPTATRPAPAAPAVKKLTLQEQIDAGQKVFNVSCALCHRAQGEGLPGNFPPLAKSDYLMADKKRSIRVVLKGLSGPIKVNGVTWSSVMAPNGHLTDEQIANVLTYVRNSFGNKGDAVSPAEVAEVRNDRAPAATADSK